MINTKLLIRPVSDISIIDTEFVDSYQVGLKVNNLDEYDILPGDFVSVVFEDTDVNQYDGTYEVLSVGITNSCCVTDPANTILIDLAWGNSGPINPGKIKNIIRNGVSIRFQTKDLDLNSDLEFPLSYSIFDIREPQNRKSDYSKAITLPGTDNNNKILGHLFEIGVDSTYNVNQKKDILVIQDGLEIFNGYMKIESISRDKWNIVSYDIKLFGRISDLFSRLKNPDGSDLMLNQLDFSEYDHEFDLETIYKSWEGSIYKNGSLYDNFDKTLSYTVSDTLFASGNRTIFQLTGTHSLQVGDVVRFEMDFPGDSTVAFDESNGMHTIIAIGATDVTVNLWFRSGAANTGTLTRYVAKGEGYVYPTMNRIGFDYLVSPGVKAAINIRSTDYVLSFFVKELIDKIFDFANTFYDSDFFESEYFKRLIITGDKFNFNPESRGLYVTSGSSIFYYSNESPIIVKFPNTIRDYGNNWVPDPTQSSFVYQNGTAFVDRQRFDILLNMSLDWGTTLSPSNGSGTTPFDAYLYRSLDPGGSPDPTWVFGFGNNEDDSGNRMIWEIFDGAYTGGVNYSDGSYSEINQTSNGFTIRLTSAYINVRPGEQIRLVILFDNPPNEASLVTIYDSYLISYDLKVSNILPDMSARNLLTSLISMHNLYIQEDSTNDRLVAIVPYIDFYSLSNAIDWTEKVDISREIKIDSLSNNSPRTYVYTYSEDKDFYNIDYNNTFKEVYGTETFTQNNEFQFEKVETQVIFPQTILTDEKSTGTFIVPTIVKDGLNTEMEEFKPRILYWTGLRYSYGLSIDKSPTADYFTTSVYGYGGHFDNPVDATIDLNFGITQYYYGYGYIFYNTENTLFNKYYKPYVDEITNKDSKLVNMYIKLNAFDINQLDFRNLILIKDILYRLQAVKDYGSLTSESTQVELIKVKNAPRLELVSGLTSSSNGSIRPYARYLGKNLSNDIVGQDGNIIINGYYNKIFTYVEGAIINGHYNIIKSNVINTTVNGYYNDVGTQSSNIYIFGNNNTVDQGLTNSFIIGNGLNATMSNTTYIGGDVIFSGTISFPPGTIPLQDLQSVLDEGNLANDVYLTLTNSNINFGSNNGTVSVSTYSVILGGDFNDIYGSNDSSIINGVNNYIELSDNSEIIGSDNVNFSNMTQSFSIGSKGFTASGLRNMGIVLLDNFSPTQSDTLYTPNVYISGDLFISGTVIGPSGPIGLQDLQSVLDEGNLAGGSYLGLDSDTINFGSSNLTMDLGSARCANISGDRNDISNHSNYSTNLGGFLNTLDLGIGSSNIGGDSLSISSSDNSSNIGGKNNTIIDSFYSSNIGGRVNYLGTSSYSSNIGGSVNDINISNYASILGGYSNNIAKSNYSSNLGGSNNILNSSIGSSNIGGDSLSISNFCYYSSNIGGGNNNINISSYSSNIGGQYNYIGTYSNYSSNIAGSGNNIINTSIHSSNIAGLNNNINNSLYSSNIGGSTNNITNGSNYSSNIGGSTNILGTYSNYSSNIGGGSNVINNSNHSSNIGGFLNNLVSANRCSNIGGNNGKIITCTSSVIIASQYATMSNCTNSAVIGLSNFTATQSNTVYVPSISIQNVINLKPQASPPSSPVEGTIYYETSVGPKFYDGSVWRTFDFT